jgi:hypothetical protein
MGTSPHLRITPQVFNTFILFSLIPNFEWIYLGLIRNLIKEMRMKATLATE